MGRHDEPNEYGFAGDPAAPQPERPHKQDVEKNRAEEAAIPGSDLTHEFSEALADSQGQDGDGDGDERRERGDTDRR